MEEGSKEADCLLHYYATGGRRSKCSAPFDCHLCPLMQQELTKYVPEQVHWICPSCVTDAIREAKSKNIPFLLPGYFIEGLCQYRSCPRPQLVVGEETLPPRYSNFLQLFIGQLEV